MLPFYAEIGRRVLELNDDMLHRMLDIASDDALMDLYILRAASRIGKKR